jgi:hypothetical protein
MIEASWATLFSGTTTNNIALPALAFTLPADVHYGLAAAKATDRAATLVIARAAWINPPPGCHHAKEHSFCLLRLGN